MDDVMQATIKQKFLEELNDAERYIDMCEKATRDGDKQIFRDIAKEEMTHAEHLKTIIREHKIPVTEAEHQKAQELYKKVKESFHNM